MHEPRLFFELALEFRSRVGLRAKGRTAGGRADQREVNSRFAEMVPDLVVLDFVQAQAFTADLPAWVFPAYLLGDIEYRVDAAMVVKHQAKGEGVVGVDEQGQSFVSSQAVEVLAKTTLRSVVGKMELDKLFESRSEVNNAIQAEMEEAASKWGVKLTRVEVQDISMPEEVEEAMRLQMAAERKRRATVTEAEGEKSAAIAMAQGQRESAILNAQGDKESAILRAQGEQESIRLVLSAMGDTEENKQTVIGYLLGQSYIKVLPNMAKEGERVFVPYESSALLGSMGMFRELAGSPEDIVRQSVKQNGLRGGMVASAGSS